MNDRSHHPALRLRHTVKACLTALVATAASVASVAVLAAPADKPNILMILADDLGYSDIGAFGSEIRTPNLDALIASGRILTNFHVAPSCSPTRAMLLSGADHHQSGLGTMAETLQIYQIGQPGYEGYLNERSFSIASLLRDGGYHTYMVGKWHLGLTPGQSPQARGFESSFVLLQGGAAHFGPTPGKITSADLASYRENGKIVALPPNFYSSRGYTDKLIDYIDRNRGDGKPFFAYAAYTAPHWPLQAPDDRIDNYRGRYDAGYDAIRDERIARQKQLGLLPPDFRPAALLPSSPVNPRWDQLSPEQKKTEARKMEVYAAMVESLDANIGRLIDHLKAIGAYESTFIFFASDNGPSGEKVDMFYPDGPNNDNRYENLGRRRSNIALGTRWAEVSATPFRLFKGYPSEGGISVPAIVRMPHQSNGQAKASQLATVLDLAPTFLQLAGLQRPGDRYRGEAVNPMTGTSLVPLLTGKTQRHLADGTMLGEEFAGNRYVRDDRWKLLSVHLKRGPQPVAEPPDWKLYDMSEDRGETTDVAAEHPDIVARLKQGWLDYARRVGVVLAPGASE
ncbi:MAG: arylsulfatase [Pandoraea sp.]|nr:arylsulfatase [Pandoraea sp.]MDR3400841.1 arylsulfatase [Pandoraea sp.]